MIYHITKADFNETSTWAKIWKRTGNKNLQSKIRKL